MNKTTDPYVIIYVVDVASGAGPACQALGFLPSGQLLIQGPIVPTHSVEAQTDTKRVVTRWMRENRPDWNVAFDLAGVQSRPFDVVAAIKSFNGREESDEFLRVISLSAQAAQAYAGREDEPVDLGPPTYPDRYAPGARVWGFRSVRCAVTISSVDRSGEDDGTPAIRDHIRADIERAVAQCVDAMPPELALYDRERHVLQYAAQEIRRALWDVETEYARGYFRGCVRALAGK